MENATRKTPEEIETLGETAQILIKEVWSAFETNDSGERISLLNYAYQILDTGLALSNLISTNDL
ncbi:MAG: hypothetical protein WC304_00750, partial [Candidatus Gracilibacteria bacterium]